jgi:membrane protein
MSTSVQAVGEREARPGLIQRLFGWILDLPPLRRPRAILRVYNDAGGSLLAEGLSYSAVFAGATGLLFCVGVLGYVLPTQADQQRLLDALTGQLAPFQSIVRDGLASIAAHASTFSLIGLAGMAWGASHFYGSLDEAIARIFARAPARGILDRILRGLVSALLLVGGLLSGIGIALIREVVTAGIGVGHEGDTGRVLSAVGFPLITAIVVVSAVGVLYRVVPNTNVPLSVLLLPTLVAGLVLTCLTELLVYLAPLLAGALSVFGGVAAVFVALAWLHLAFQVLLIGAAWTRLRLDDSITRARQLP